MKTTLYHLSPVKFRKIFLHFSIVALIISLGSCSADEELLDEEQPSISAEISASRFSNVEEQLNFLTQRMRKFYNHQVAIAQGWDEDGTGYMPQMGHHFVNAATFTDDFDMLKPEALLYVPDENGVMQFVGVEYLVFEEPTNIRPAPEGFIGEEDVWIYSELYNAWTLHAWVRLENPDGVFAPFNPLLD